MNTDKSKEDESATPSTQAATNATKDELELDDINSNSCMPIILDLIDTMEQKFGATYDKSEMPKWMYELHSKFTNSGNDFITSCPYLKLLTPIFDYSY